METEVENPVAAPKSGSKAWLVIVIIIGVLIIAGGIYYFLTHRTSNGISDVSTTAGILGGEKVTKPSNFPTDIPVYDDVTFNSFVNDGPGDGIGYSGTTNNAPSTVLSWFKTELPKSGWTIEVENANMLSISKTNSVGSVNIHDNTKGAFLLSVSVIPSTNSEYQVAKDQQDLLKQMQN